MSKDPCPIIYGPESNNYFIGFDFATRYRQPTDVQKYEPRQQCRLAEQDASRERSIRQSQHRRIPDRIQNIGETNPKVQGSCSMVRENQHVGLVFTNQIMFFYKHNIIIIMIIINSEKTL